jgi:hypothetical protein
MEVTRKVHPTTEATIKKIAARLWREMLRRMAASQVPWGG